MESSSATKTQSYSLKPWKVALMGIAGVMVIVGAGLGLAGSGAEDGAGTASSSGSPPPTGLAPNALVEGAPTPGRGGTGTPDTAEGTDSEGIWSPALLRGGISFFIAFCLAFALRIFLRVALIFIGVWGASLFYLDYLGWVEVHWDVIDQWFAGITTNIGEQFESMKTFVTGSLPSAGLAGLGLFTGFKKG